MRDVLVYRDDVPPRNSFSRYIVSPLRPSLCCSTHMARIGHGSLDGGRRFFYTQCQACGYTVRCFHAAGLSAVEGRQIERRRPTLRVLERSHGRLVREGEARRTEPPRVTDTPPVPPSRVPSKVSLSMLRRFLRHHLNALHVMAALIRWRIPRTWALAMARRWERVSRWWLYPAGK